MVLKYIFNSIKLFFRKNVNVKGMCFFEQATIRTVKNSLVTIGKKNSARKEFNVFCSSGASIFIGDKCFFNKNCILACKKEIIIGDNCIFGPNVCIFDHDHNYKNYPSMRDSFVSSSIRIGEGTWVGANVTILKGAQIGNRCVIAAGTIVTSGDYPDDSLIYNDRILKTRKIER